LILLDTCALIWLVAGDLDESPAAADIESAARESAVLVSTVSAWEIGLLTRKRPNAPPRLELAPDPKTWFSQLLAQPRIRLAGLTPGIAIDASHLPGELHGDPADRLLVATARHYGVPVVTRDRRILSYARDGFVGAIAC